MIHTQKQCVPNLILYYEMSKTIEATDKISYMGKDLEIPVLFSVGDSNLN